MSDENTVNRSLRWKRSPGQLKIWRVVETRAKGKDKLPLRFSIQDIPKERFNEVLDHFCEYYLSDEPICKSLHVKENPSAVEDFRNEWREVLEQGVSIGAFLIDSNLKRSRLVGANVLYVGSKGDYIDIIQKISYKSETAEKMIRMFWQIQTDGNIFDKCGSDTYIGAIGLSVDPQFRGCGLAKHLVDARTEMGRELGVPDSVTIFTGSASQMVALKTGFKVLVEKRPDEIVDENNKVICPVGLSTTMKLMYKRLY